MRGIGVNGRSVGRARPRVLWTWQQRAKTVSVTGLAVTILALGVTGTAAAQIVGDPVGVVQIGTESSDNPGGYVAIANGGCAYGVTLAVGIGGCSPEALASVGLLGAGARGAITVADRGDSQGAGGGFLPIPPGVGVTGGGGTAGCNGGGTTVAAVNLGDGWACAGSLAVANSGYATGNNAAVSNSGNARGDRLSVSVMGTAGHSDDFNDGSYYCDGQDVAISLTADACSGWGGVAIAPNGDAWGPTAIGTGPYKRAAANGAEGAGGTGTFIHTGLNAVEDAYQAAVVATAPVPDPVQLAQKHAWASHAAACVTAQLATGVLLPPPTEPSPPPPPGTAQCLMDDPTSQGANRSASASTDDPPMYPWWAHFFAIHLESGYTDGCVPQMAKAMYGSYGMPSQKRLYNEMGTKRAGGTTLSTGAAVIRKYFLGPSTPVAETADDPDTVMSRVVSMLLNAYQPTILGMQPGRSHWRGADRPEQFQIHYGQHAVGTWGYFLGGGGALFLVDGYDRPDWGEDNPYGIGNYVPLAKVFTAMADNEAGMAEMIW